MPRSQSERFLGWLAAASSKAEQQLSSTLVEVDRHQLTHSSWVLTALLHSLFSIASYAILVSRLTPPPRGHFPNTLGATRLLVRSFSHGDIRTHEPDHEWIL